jgi:hypothetical protein
MATERSTCESESKKASKEKADRTEMKKIISEKEEE